MIHRVARLYIFESNSLETLEKQLGASQADGLKIVRDGELTIRAITLPGQLAEMMNKVLYDHIFDKATSG